MAAVALAFGPAPLNHPILSDRGGQGVTQLANKARLVTQSGTSFLIPHAPPLSHTGLATDIGQAPRVGLNPITWVGGRQLRQYTLTMTLVGRNEDGNLDPTYSIETKLHDLRAMARSGERVKLMGFGPSSVGWYLMSDLTIDDKRRHPTNNHITHAEAQLKLTEATDARVYVGPISGGALIVARQAEHAGTVSQRSAAEAAGAAAVRASVGMKAPGGQIPSPLVAGATGHASPSDVPANLILIPGATGDPASAAAAAGANAVRASAGTTAVYVSRDGDTWFSVAFRAYGNGNLWMKLASYNGFGVAQLTAGVSLKLPPVGKL